MLREPNVLTSMVSDLLSMTSCEALSTSFMSSAYSPVPMPQELLRSRPEYRPNLAERTPHSLDGRSHGAKLLDDDSLRLRVLEQRRCLYTRSKCGCWSRSGSPFRVSG